MIIKSLKRMLHKALNIFGIDIVKTEHFHDGLALHLKNVFNSREIDCVIDVGANAGQYGKFLRGLGFDGYIVSFEPVRSVFKELKKATSNDQKWLCYNVALSDSRISQSINVYSETKFSSFLSVNEYSKRIWEMVDEVMIENVEVAQLDDFIDEILRFTKCRNIYLKLDTQGHDLHVFKGALISLEHVRAMQSELSLISVYEGMQNPYVVLSKYHEQGFYISGLYPINRDVSLAVIEYDCVLVKRN